MNNYIKKLYLLPLLGFLTAGCSTSSYLQSSEVDDVYFSSSDKVTYSEPEYAPASEEVQLADGSYSENIEGRVSDPETYAERRERTPYQYSYYDAPFGNPFYAYHDPFYFPGRYYSRAAMMSPWIDPWYDPFYGPSMAMMYDPFWPRYGTGMSVSIGIGWGRAYNPWGYGYGMYNPYRYGGYYGGGYYGGFNDFYRSPVAARRVHYAPRNDRGSNVSHNPNISRDGRNSVIANEGRRSRSGNTSSPGQVNRPRSTAGQAYPEGTSTQPARTRRSTISPAPARSREVIQPSRSSGGSSTPPPTRRRRDSPSAASSRSETRQPTPPRSSYEPSRSSYEPSRSTYSPPASSGSSGRSSGSSSGSSSGRRGRN
ncbi:hypothetical protein [Rufibacter roseus]|uniref:Uncharacterized protein n=1 Tax=Rufibacter roseus TaxID=1567108 RepID=A0ABW2DEF5_9BACT|nr:hypothetical protein [Rufibacter roseus]